MTHTIKTDIEHLKIKAEEIKAKIQELMHKPDAPDYEENIGGLNATLDAIINEITLNTN